MILHFDLRQRINSRDEVRFLPSLPGQDCRLLQCRAAHLHGAYPLLSAKPNNHGLTKDSRTRLGGGESIGLDCQGTYISWFIFP